MAALSALHACPARCAEASAAWILASKVFRVTAAVPCTCGANFQHIVEELFTEMALRSSPEVVSAISIGLTLTAWCRHSASMTIQSNTGDALSALSVLLRRSRALLYNGAGTHFKTALPIRNNETTNVANTSVQLLNGELLAMWEAGAPYRLDPDSLTTLGQLEFNADLSGVPFSAHPHFDEKGELWNIGSVPFARHPTLLPTT